MIIPRKALELPKNERRTKPQQQEEQQEPVPLSDLREQHAWVLLGEPGAGKTTAFEEEAKTCGCEFISVAEFIHPESSLDDWQNKTLFLDGLDEVTGDLQNTLISIRERLKKLDRPKFRLSCRAADWQGTLFLEQLQKATPPETTINVYTLEPLSEADIETLALHLGAENSKSILEFARQHQASDWLGHPQTLEWILNLPAQEGPTSLQDLLEKTCARLAQEHNRKHRSKHQQNSNPPNTQGGLEAAGELFAYLLLSNKRGIAGDRDAKTDLYPALNDFNPNNTTTCTQALKTQLFKQAHSAQEHLEPIHRRVAEYLGARWLAQQLDRQLPLSRLFNVLTGYDWKCIEGLRGLYAWLACLSTSARECLIARDPISLALYAEVHTWDAGSIKTLLETVQREIQKDPALLSRHHNSNLKNLYRPDHEALYVNWLRAKERTEAHQHWLHEVIQVLKNNRITPALSQELLRILKDSTYYTSVRFRALDAWLQCQPSKPDRLTLLNDIHNQTVADADEELMNELLSASYPSSLSTQEVLTYFKRPDSLADYFWVYKFPQDIPSSDLQQTMNALAQHPIIVQSIDHNPHGLAEMLSKLLARAITEVGNQTPDAQLLDWLMIGVDQHGTNHLRDVVKHENHQLVTQWMQANPQRHPGLLREACRRADQHSEPVRQLWRYEQALKDFPPSPSLANWYLAQIDQTTHPALKQELSKRTVPSPTNEWWHLVQQEQQAFQEQREQQTADEKQKRSQELKPRLPLIEQGTAPAGVMGLAAQLWNGELVAYRGKTPEERLAKYGDHVEEHKHAIEQGMPRCLERTDLPTCDEIIQLHIQKHQYYSIQPACLLGAQFVFEKDPTHFFRSPENTLKMLVCFHFTNHREHKETAWFLSLAQHKPNLLVDVFTALGKAYFKAKRAHFSQLNDLKLKSKDCPELHRFIRDCTMPLLDSFPLRATAAQVEQLRTLLQLALQQGHDLHDLISKKLSRTSLDSAQKTHYLLAGFIQNPTHYESQLLPHLRASNQAIEHLYKFCFTWRDQQVDFQSWSSHILGQLIELSAPLVPAQQTHTGVVRVLPLVDWGMFAHTLIQELSKRTEKASVAELERLMALPTSSRLQYNLREAKHQVTQRLREESFKFLEPRDLSNILNNKTPVNAADLHALTLAYLDDIAQNIQTSNSDIYKQFWNEKPDKIHKDENSCRDALLELLKGTLTRHDVSCRPESDYVNDKRADIQLSVGPNISIPIEIKGEWHKDLWNAIEDQLIPQYTREKSSEGFGIYVVFWFGGTMLTPKDGGKKPQTPKELQDRLKQHSVPKAQESLITVRVLDVSWPT